MEKKVLLKDLVDTGTNLRKQIISKVRVSDEGVYPIGELWDANTTLDVIVNGAHEQHDTMKELEDYVNDVDNRLNAEVDRAKSAEQQLAEDLQRSIVTESTVADWGFTKNNGTVIGAKVGSDDTIIYPNDEGILFLPESGAALYGTIKVNLQAIIDDTITAGSDLNGVVVSVQNATDGTEAVTKVWQGDELVFNTIIPQKQYTISVSTVYGYTTPQSRTIELSVGQESSNTFQYLAKKLFLVVKTNHNDPESVLNDSIVRISANGISATGYLDFTGKQNETSFIAPAGEEVSHQIIQRIDSDSYTARLYNTLDTFYVVYESTILTVIVDSDTGDADLSDVSFLVTDVTDQVKTIEPREDGTYMIPMANRYHITMQTDIDGFETPADYDGTASEAYESVTMTYVKNNLQYVDLGLPSGTLWATGNIISDNKGGYTIGAETDYGAYFSWGNIEPHFSTDGVVFDDSYDFGTTINGPYSSTPGASLSSNIPANSSTYDAALATLGSPWHLPTQDDCRELYQNTNYEFTTIDGVYGCKFMNKTDNSVYVFFPMAGRSDSNDGTTVNGRGTKGAYLSQYRVNNLSASAMQFNYTPLSPVAFSTPQNRWIGSSVRAVQYPHHAITINVEVYDPVINKVVDGVNGGITVSITDSEGNSHVGVTDENGQATFEGVANGRAEVTSYSSSEIDNLVPYNYYSSPNVTNTNTQFNARAYIARRGVYAVYSDGRNITFKSPDDADNSAICAALFTNNGSLYISKYNNGPYQFGLKGVDVSMDVTTTQNKANAQSDFQGKTNTDGLYHIETDEYENAYQMCFDSMIDMVIGPSCHLASAGQLYEMYLNKDAINEVMERIGGNTMFGDTTDEYWSSTAYNSTQSTWYINNAGILYAHPRDMQKLVRPVANIYPEDN